MTTQTIEVTLQPGENAVINIARLSKRIKIPKKPFSYKDENGDYTLRDKHGILRQRLNKEHFRAIFKQGHATFNAEASSRIGGVLGVTSRLIYTLANVRHEYKKGNVLFGVGGNIPRINDFVITQDSEGRVSVDRKF